MKAYTINLKRCSERREYIKTELQQMPFIINEFIDGVDGSTLSPSELKQFNSKLSFKIYGRKLKLGEIGCTLSHRKCYKTVINNNNRSAIIFEDDIVITNINKTLWNDLKEFIEQFDKPAVILLSGGWWEYGNKQNSKSLNLRKIYNAYYTHAYIINYKAASLMDSIPIAYLADDWKRFKKYGLHIFAIKPHLVDQQWNGSMPSIIQTNSMHGFDSMNWIYKLKSYLNIIPCKILGLLGLHESDNYSNQKQI